MKILWLAGDPVAEGAMGVTARIEGVRHLVRGGHDVSLLTAAPRTARPIPGVPTVFVHSRHVPFVAWLALWPKVRRALRRLPAVPDVVVSDFALLPPVMGWARGLRRNGGRAPAIVLDVRSHPVEARRIRLAAQRMRFAWTLGRYGRRVDALTAISPQLRDHVAALAGLGPERVTVWTTGCAWCEQDLELGGAPSEWPRAFTDRLVFFYHGAMSPGRGLFESLRAFEIVRRQASDVAMVLLGDGVARPRLEALARRLGVEQDVAFLDPVPLDRVPEFLAQADVGLAPWPATWDMEANCPLKLTEYLCTGLPVVLTDMRAHRIVPPSAPFAFWAMGSTPEDLADAMLRAVRARPRLPRLGAEARAWGRSRLGWSPQFAVLEETVRLALEMAADQDTATGTAAREAPARSRKSS